MAGKGKGKPGSFFYVRGGIFEIAPACPKNKDGSAYSEKMRISILVSESQTRLDLYVGNRSFFSRFCTSFPFLYGTFNSADSRPIPKKDWGRRLKKWECTAG